VASQSVLFRQEAIDFQQQHRQGGQVTLLQPLSTKIITWFVAASIAIVIIFLCLLDNTLERRQSLAT
jgi:membrane fusion protein